MDQQAATEYAAEIGQELWRQEELKRREAESELLALRRQVEELEKELYELEKQLTEGEIYPPQGR